MSEAMTSTNATVSDHGVPDLDSNSYVASRLAHASPEHLHLTSRRFFIGPIPEGWLNSNRKAWYRRRLELNNYSSRQATFTATGSETTVPRTTHDIQPSLAARMRFSFPQPDDVFDDPTQDDHIEEDDIQEEDVNDVEEEVETTTLAPVSTVDAPLDPTLADPAVNDQMQVSDSPGHSDSRTPGLENKEPVQSTHSKSKVDSWETAPENHSNFVNIGDSGLETRTDVRPDIGGRKSTSTQDGRVSSLQVHGGLGVSSDNIDSSSRTALLQAEDHHTGSNGGPLLERTMTKHPPAPVQSPDVSPRPGRKGPGVRFKVAEGVADRQRRITQKVDRARYRASQKIARRDALKAGTIVKMQRMLVRIDTTMQQLPDDFDENESVKTDTTQIEKWREFMVVARRSDKQDQDDFRLQFYDTRVIPKIQTESSKKKPAREVKLLPNSTHVNLYSSLDKTVVVWHPYRKGTRMLILKPSSAAHSVEWYTFLRDALGWHRSNMLQVNVPDLDVSLRLERPFQDLDAAVLEAENEETALAKAVEVEKAVAGRIISQSVEMLRTDPEWTEVLKTWSETEKMGLAWKRYDRLEWVYGVNEQKMFGSMAMQQSYDLELRPKHHYPTSAYGKKGVLHEEPPPIEGFLVRLTSQKGVHRRFGKAFFKRLYYSTYNEHLVFNRPAKVTPPHPPRLATTDSGNVPSSADIIQKTPMIYEIEPFKSEHGKIKWLKAGQQDVVNRHDADALEDSRRNLANLLECDGFINLCHVVKVRKLSWGATEADDVLDSGSDVDFHAPVDDTVREDGATTEIDDRRTFELLLDNGLVVRLQAYNEDTRNEWMKRLRKLVKYWKLRAAADVAHHKAIRQSNLAHLNIDEEVEARLGQFARKWEVSRSDASPYLYNMCRLASCRTITMSGMLYRKARKYSTFERCSVILAGGQMLVFQATLRKLTGQQIPHIHQEKQQAIDLKDCYIYSGLIAEGDLLYQNRTFDTNHAGMLAATPRVYLDDGWTSTDVDVMTCFVLWQNHRRAWFRSVVNDEGGTSTQSGNGPQAGAQGGTRSKLKRVSQLGVPGRGMVFKCRSRAERDLWVLSVAAEIEAAIEKDLCKQGRQTDDELTEVRLEQ